MKLGEGGEAFFVFETSDEIPASLQTSPVVSPVASPSSIPLQDVSSIPTLQEPEFLDLTAESQGDSKSHSELQSRPALSAEHQAQSDYGELRVCSSRRESCSFG